MCWAARLRSPGVGPYLTLSKSRQWLIGVLSKLTGKVSAFREQFNYLNRLWFAPPTSQVGVLIANSLLGIAS